MKARTKIARDIPQSRVAHEVLAQDVWALKLAARKNAKKPLRGRQPAPAAPLWSIPERSTYRALRRIRDGVAFFWLS